jgi:RNA polymerase sigma-70 factor (ECF subfamily)
MDQEHEWIARARAGDQAAFGRLVERYERSVYRTVYRMLRDRDEAAELTQEAMVRAWENLSRFRGDSPFAGWLSRIAIYLALNRLREKKRYVRPEDAARHDAVIDQTPAAGPSPLNELLLREAKEALRQALAELPDEFRVPLVLRLYEDFSYEQIAEALDIPIGTVMSRLYRARERLARRVRELLG